jgi:cytochrome c553
MKKLLPALALLLFPAVAFPQDPPGCTACHGENGEGKPGAAPAIGGQPEAYLARQMEAYANGKRDHPVMTPIAKALTREQRASMAAFFSRLIPPPQKSSAAPTRSELGRTLATKGDESQRVQACENCHGPGGTGQQELTPHLAGLSAAYLESALRAFRDGTRVTDPSLQMTQIAKNLSEADTRAVAAHYGGQPLPQMDMARRPPPAGQKDQPTQAGAGQAPTQGVGASGGEATTGGSQGPGGGGGASGSGTSGSNSGGTPQR